MAKKEKLEVWQQPIVFDRHPLGGATTKAQYERVTKKLGRPLSWRPHADVTAYGINSNVTHHTQDGKAR